MTSRTRVDYGKVSRVDILTYHEGNGVMFGVEICANVESGFGRR